LHHIFSFGGIAKYLQSYLENKPMVSIKQNRQRISVTRLQVRHKLIIREPSQLTEIKPTRLYNVRSKPHYFGLRECITLP
jgi:hypothetical protein